MAAKLTTMNVSLPTALRDFVQKQVDSGGFANASEYVRHLIREEQHRLTADPELERLLWEGINSGPPREVNDEFWADVKKNARRRAAAIRASRRKKAG